MNNIQQFLDHGCFTVPLNGETLTRDNSHNKILLDKSGHLLVNKEGKPDYFQNKGWDCYKKHRNTTLTPLIALICGETSGIVVIDCDNQKTFDTFRALDPTNTLITENIGKAGGHIYYLYNEDIKSFSKHEPLCNLDFQSNNRLIFLPTKNNLTKQPWNTESLSDLKEMPAKVLGLLKTLKTYSRTLEEACKRLSYFNLATQSTIDTILPKADKGKDLTKMGDNTGRNTLISETAFKLAKNTAIDKPLFQSTMDAINSLMLLPLSDTTATLNSALKGWNTPTNTKEMTGAFTFKDKNKDEFTTFYDKNKSLNYIVDNADSTYTTLSDSECRATIGKYMGSEIKPKMFPKIMYPILTHLDARKDFGFTDEHNFNLFKQTEELKVLNNPSAYAKQYKKPEKTLAFLNHLIPDEPTRLAVLGFIKRKFTTFAYSPTIIYFEGVRGSGKDVFVKIIKRIIGKKNFSAPKPPVFFDKFNDYMEDVYITHLSEYSTLCDSRQKKQLLGLLKDITGSDEYQLRPFHGKTRENQTNHTTFIIASNENTYEIKADDRNILGIQTSEIKLIEEKNIGIEQAGGIFDFCEAIYEEAVDFCYYLATEVEMLSIDAYIDPSVLNLVAREQFVKDSMSTSAKIADLLVKKDFASLIEMANDYQIPDFTKNWDRGQLRIDKLQHLLAVASEKTEKVNKLTIELNDRKFPKKEQGKEWVQKGGDDKRVSYYFYLIPELTKYTPEPDVFDNEKTTNEAKIINFASAIG